MIKDDLRGRPRWVYGRITTNQASGQALQAFHCVAMAAPRRIAAQDRRFQASLRRCHIAIQWIEIQAQVRC